MAITYFLAMKDEGHWTFLLPVNVPNEESAINSAKESLPDGYDEGEIAVAVGKLKKPVPSDTPPKEFGPLIEEIVYYRRLVEGVPLDGLPQDILEEIAAAATHYVDDSLDE